MWCCGEIEGNKRRRKTGEPRTETENWEPRTETENWEPRTENRDPARNKLSEILENNVIESIKTFITQETTSKQIKQT